MPVIITNSATMCAARVRMDVTATFTVFRY